jgi:hypothetical protein
VANNPFEIYVVIGQISGAFAGFGSLASGLGRRRGGDDARVDAMRLAMMLSASLSATLLGLLPATLISFSLDEQSAVRASAVVALIAMFAYAPISIKRSRRIRNVSGFSKGGALANYACSLTALLAFVLCALRIPSGQGPALYLLGLMGLLSSSIVMFSRVIASMLRPHNAAHAAD